MNQRAYTAAEIAALREVCSNKTLWGCYDYNRVRGWSKSYKTGEHDKAVAAMVDQMMRRGVTAKDLVDEEARLDEKETGKSAQA